MTECELCGRATVQKALTPGWWDYDTVCDRARCRAAARDATEAVLADREHWWNLAASIASRADDPHTQAEPLSWRQDTMSEFDVVDDGDEWFVDIAKRVKA